MRVIYLWSLWKLTAMKRHFQRLQMFFSKGFDHNAKPSLGFKYIPGLGPEIHRDLKGVPVWYILGRINQAGSNMDGIIHPERRRTPVLLLYYQLRANAKDPKKASLSLGSKGSFSREKVKEERVQRLKYLHITHSIPPSHKKRDLASQILFEQEKRVKVISFRSLEGSLGIPRMMGGILVLLHLWFQLPVAWPPPQTTKSRKIWLFLWQGMFASEHG